MLKNCSGGYIRIGTAVHRIEIINLFIFCFETDKTLLSAFCFGRETVIGRCFHVVFITPLAPAARRRPTYMAWSDTIKNLCFCTPLAMPLPWCHPFCWVSFLQEMMIRHFMACFIKVFLHLEKPSVSALQNDAALSIGRVAIFWPECCAFNRVLNFYPTSAKGIPE